MYVHKVYIALNISFMQEGHTAQDIENQLTKTLGDVPENEYTEVVRTIIFVRLL